MVKFSVYLNRHVFVMNRFKHHGVFRAIGLVLYVLCVALWLLPAGLLSSFILVVVLLLCLAAPV